MATYSGSSGIQQLRAKIAMKSKMLVGETAENITVALIDNSPVGVELYPSRLGMIPNDAGDFKNSWQVGLGSPDQSIRAADPSGSGAVANAIVKGKAYNFQEAVFITNSVDHAEHVEDGWQERPEYGWKAKGGYHVVSGNVGLATAIAIAVANKVKQL